MRTIKRYRNRKLYDTETSRYVTLPEVLNLALGEPLQVIDQATGRSLKAHTLALAVAQRVEADERPEVVQLLVQLGKSLPSPSITPNHASPSI